MDENGRIQRSLAEPFLTVPLVPNLKSVLLNDCDGRLSNISIIIDHVRWQTLQKFQESLFFLILKHPDRFKTLSGCL